VYSFTSVVTAVTTTTRGVIKTTLHKAKSTPRQRPYIPTLIPGAKTANTIMQTL